MTAKGRILLKALYSQTGDLGAYSHHLSAAQCDQAFRDIQSIVLFLKVDNPENEYECECAMKASEDLNQLINFAKNGNTGTDGETE